MHHRLSIGSVMATIIQMTIALICYLSISFKNGLDKISNILLCSHLTNMDGVLKYAMIAPHLFGSWFEYVVCLIHPHEQFDL